MNTVSHLNTMQLAHKNAAYGVKQFGGCKSDYMAEALRLAHKGINLEKANKRTTGDVLASLWESTEAVVIGIVFGVFSSVIGMGVLAYSIMIGSSVLVVGGCCVAICLYLACDSYRLHLRSRLNDRRVRINRMSQMLAA